MTGRRAVRQWDERLSRALQFVPGHVGGRVASAQPIRRRGGTLRRVSVGAASVAAPLVPAYRGYANAGTGGNLEYILTDAYYIESGMAVVVLAASTAGATLSLPSGWTSLASGTLASSAVRYAIGWCVWDGTQGMTIGSDAPGSVDAQIMAFEALPAGAEVKCSTVTSVASDTDHPLPTYTSGLSAPWPVLFTTEAAPPPTGAAYGTWAWEEAYWNAERFGTFGAREVHIGHCSPHDPSNSLTYCADTAMPSGASITTDQACTSAAFSMGLGWA